MKKTIISLLVALLSVAVQAQVKMKINGVCKPKVDTVMIYNIATRKVVDKVKTENGTFAYTLNGVSMEAYGVGTKNYFMPFFCDGSDINVDLVTQKLSGSELNLQLCRCDKLLDRIDSELRSNIMSLAMSGKATDSIEAEYEKMMKQRMVDKLAVLEQYRSTLVPVVYLPQLCKEMSLDEVKKWLDPETPFFSHPDMQVVKRYAANIEKKSVGRMFVDLTMQDLEGNTHSLSEWCGKGNYVLVDFWASWCAPCRREMPNVVASYVKYHPKGYEVVGVSFDNKKAAWATAVKQLGMDWIQISDLKGWGCAASDAYGVDAIPSNVLLDPDGRIVASDLRGPDLEHKLQEIYGF